MSASPSRAVIGSLLPISVLSVGVTGSRAGRLPIRSPSSLVFFQCAGSQLEVELRERQASSTRSASHACASCRRRANGQGTVRTSPRAIGFHAIRHRRISIQLVGVRNLGTCLKWRFDLVLGPGQDSLETKTHLADVTRREYGSPASRYHLQASRLIGQSLSQSRDQLTAVLPNSPESRVIF
jgi:hypothetical protein